MLPVVEIATPHIPHVLAVEVDAVGVADEDGGQQPGEEEGVLQHCARLLIAVFEDVAACRHHDHAGQGGSNGGEHKAELDAPQGGLVGEEAGDGALAGLVGAPVGEVLVVLGAEEVHQGPVGEIQLLHADGPVGLEGKDDNHHHRDHVDDEEHIGVDVGQDVGDRVGDLLLLQPGLGLGNRQVVALSLIGGEHRQQHDGEHGQNNAQQGRPGLGEGLVGRGGAGQADDLRVDGVIAQQGGGGHGAQARDEGHDRQGEHGGDQGGEDHLPEDLEGLGPHVPGRLHGVVVDAPDGVSQKEHVVAGAGEGHGEEHGVEPGEPVGVHAREGVDQQGGDDAVAVVEEQVAGHQGHAGVDEGGHIAQAEDPRTLDVKVLRQKHGGHAHHVHRHHQAHGQLQGVPHVGAHAAGEEEADHRQGVPLSGGVDGVEHAGQGVQAGQKHEAQKQVCEKGEAKDLRQELGAEALGTCRAHGAHLLLIPFTAGRPRGRPSRPGGP